MANPADLLRAGVVSLALASLVVTPVLVAPQVWAASSSQTGTTKGSNEYGVSATLVVKWESQSCDSGTNTGWRISSYSAKFARTYAHRSAVVHYKLAAGQGGTMSACSNGKSVTDGRIHKVVSGTMSASWPSLLSSSTKKITPPAWPYDIVGGSGSSGDTSGSFSGVQLAADTYDASSGYPAIKLCVLVYMAGGTSPNKCSFYPAS